MSELTAEREAFDSSVGVNSDDRANRDNCVNRDCHDNLDNNDGHTELRVDDHHDSA